MQQIGKTTLFIAFFFLKSVIINAISQIQLVKGNSALSSSLLIATFL
jgi:hypothetical protein